MRKPTGIIGECKAHGVNAAVTDGLFWRELRKYLTDKDYLRDQIQEFLVSDMNQNKLSTFEKEKLREQVLNGKEEQDRYARAYGTATLDFEQFKELMEKIDNPQGGR